MQNNSYREFPRFFAWLIRKLYPGSDDTRIGDFIELYNNYIDEKVPTSARFWLLFYILRSYPSFFIASVSGSIAILQNYLKSAYRSIRRHRTYSIINVSGLAIGLVCFILIFIWAADQLSYDRFHTNADRLFRVESDVNRSGRWFHSIASPVGLSAALEQEVPEIEFATRCSRFGGIQLRVYDKSMYENNAVAVDQSITSMFSFNFIFGDLSSAFDSPFSLVLSRRYAERYFGPIDPVGKTVLIEGKHAFTVTGVFENLPDNSSLRFNVLIPFQFVNDHLRRMPTGWVNSITNYVQIKPGSDITTVEEKITALVKSKADSTPESRYTLKPLTRIHLHSYIGFEKKLGRIGYVYAFSLIALFVVLIACINYINLSTARLGIRAREIGIRKIVGAVKQNVVRQFYIESVFMAFLALTAALLTAVLMLPVFNSLSGKQFGIGEVINPLNIIILIVLTILIGIFSGSYPAIYLSSFNIIEIIRNSSVRARKKAIFRKPLVILQFSLSILLISGSMIVYHQVEFMKNRETGYNKSNIVYLRMPEEIKRSYESFIEELKTQPGILNISASGRTPVYVGDTSREIHWNGKAPDTDVSFTFWAVDYDFVETMEIEMTEGRSFSREFPGDKQGSFLINETAAKIIGSDSHVGKQFSIFDLNGEITGVMKDFHFQPFRNEINPLVIFIAPNPYWLGNFLLRLSPDNPSGTMDLIESVWNRVFPGSAFQYRFLEDDLRSVYRSEEQLGTFLRYFTALAVLIACLGLFALIAFISERRRKEIGIRKVLGASISSIIVMLCREVGILILAANLIMLPFALYAADSWLNEFAYRVETTWPVYVLTLFLTLIAALITVSKHAWKAAASSPITSITND